MHYSDLNRKQLGRSATIGLRLALGAILLWAGLSKLQQPYEFLEAVYNYELLGPTSGLWIARLLPWLEVCVGGSLVFGVWELGGSMAAVCLFSVFTVAQASAAAQGLKIPCGCAIGTEPEFTSGWKVVESALMLAAAGFVFAGSRMLALPRDSASGQLPG